MKNAHHQWRCRPVPACGATCVVCAVVDPQRGPQTCIGYDHDLRGHLCIDDFHAARNAERALAQAQLSDSDLRSLSSDL